VWGQRTVQLKGGVPCGEFVQTGSVGQRGTLLLASYCVVSLSDTSKVAYQYHELVSRNLADILLHDIVHPHVAHRFDVIYTMNVLTINTSISKYI
jgi:hypothetical protein